MAHQNDGEKTKLDVSAEQIVSGLKFLYEIKKSRDERFADLEQRTGKRFEDWYPFFVQPDLIDLNPLVLLDQPGLVSRERANEVIARFLSSAPGDYPGGRVLFVLGDGGAGKTTLLTSIAFSSLTKPWRSHAAFFDTIGPRTLSALEKVERPMATIALLDALDEDPAAHSQDGAGRRVHELLELTRSRGFFRVIVSCRTGYFRPSEPYGSRSAVVEHDGQVRVADFRCRAKYIAPLSDRQMQEAIERRAGVTRVEGFVRRYFGVDLNEDSPRYRRAASFMSDLASRPLLLSYLPDIVSRQNLITSVRDVYGAVVDEWLSRESRKILGIREGLSSEAHRSDTDRVMSVAGELGEACRMLAVHFETRDVDRIDERALAELTKDQPKLGRLKTIEFGGRSLLTRDHAGAFRFAHRTFREFFVADAIRAGAALEGVVATRPLHDFLLSNASTRVRADDGPQVAVAGGTAPLAHLRSMVFRILTWEMTSTGSTRFERCTFAGGSLKRARLVGTTFDECELRNVDASGSRLEQVTISGVADGLDLSGATLIGVDLSGLRKAGYGIRFHGAEYDKKTTLPAWLVPAEHEMREIPTGTRPHYARSTDVIPMVSSARVDPKKV